MKKAQTLCKKKTSKKGFTLPEMLIVIAIIAILIAIAVPVLSAQLDEARQGVDDANLRAATSMAVADTLLNGVGGTYVAINDGNGTMSVTKDPGTSPSYYPGKKETGHIQVVTTANGGVTSADWVS